MISALAAIDLAAKDVNEGRHWTQKLLGHSSPDGHFALSNMSLDITQSSGHEGLAALEFATPDLVRAIKNCQRRALEPEREGQKLVLSRESTFGVPVRLVTEARTRSTTPSNAEGAVMGLDHVVVRTYHPNRAAALYGARLGLDMRLDKTEPKWGARLMFFRAGDLIIEVVHNLSDGLSDAPDKLWGLSWRVQNIKAAHARLKTSGFDISEIRVGRKPGTRVFTVKNNTLGVPTLILEPPQSTP